MKIKVWCDSSANINFWIESTIEVDAEEWAEMNGSARYKMVRDWVMDQINIGWEE